MGHVGKGVGWGIWAWGWSCRGGVDHVRVGWDGSCRDGVGWVM